MIKVILLENSKRRGLEKYDYSKNVLDVVNLKVWTINIYENYVHGFEIIYDRWVSAFLDIALCIWASDFFYREINAWQSLTELLYVKMIWYNM